MHTNVVTTDLEILGGYYQLSNSNSGHFIGHDPLLYVSQAVGNSFFNASYPHIGSMYPYRTFNDQDSFCD